jgi:hypothetical protein
MARIALFIYSLIGALNILSAVIEQPMLRTVTKPLIDADANAVCFFTNTYFNTK